MGNYLHTLSEQVQYFTSKQLWLEGEAILQLEKTAKLPGIKKAIGLPDLHPSRGYPIGAAFFSQSIIYPALVGNDIGCGMALFKTDAKVKKCRLDKLNKRLGNIDGPLTNAEWVEIENNQQDLMLQVKNLQQELENFSIEFSKNLQRNDGNELWTQWCKSLGTIGGGNHFVEIQAVDEINKDSNDLKQNLLLMVHSGSRGLGEMILKSHVLKWSHNGLDSLQLEQQVAWLNYWLGHDLALKYAKLNRRLIAARIANRLAWHCEVLLDQFHNFIEPISSSLGSGFLHRKGASASNAGAIVIPGSRGDYSYWVQPSPNNGEENLWSLPHGAGRKWARHNCKGNLSKNYQLKDLLETQFKSLVICDDRELVYEEAAQAYKNIDSVVELIKEAGLIDVIARLKPVLSYKTRGGCCE